MTEPPEGAGDEELVRRVRQGDQAAAAALYRRYEGLLRARAARRIVGGVRRKLGVSDVVQETYAAAFAGLDAFEDRGPGSFKRWLTTIAERKAADQVRRHLRDGRSARREVSVGRDGSGAGPADPEPTPSVAAVAEEDRVALLRALSAMPEDHRTVLRLVLEEGKGFVEAAAAMGRSADAVRKLYGRAVLQLGREVRRTP